MSRSTRLCARQGQRGATTVEFAFISIWLMVFVIGMIELGRVMLVWNSAAEATRLGARRAAVCNVVDATERGKIETAMKAAVGLSDTATLSAAITLVPAGCDNGTTPCQAVTATVGGTVPTFIPFVTFSPTLPSFSTTLPRESMSSTNNGAVCKSTL